MEDQKDGGINTKPRGSKLAATKIFETSNNKPAETQQPSKPAESDVGPASPNSFVPHMFF
jgi:hypothetical protein